MGARGAVVYPDGDARGRIVRVSYRNHSSTTAIGKRLGEAICDYPDKQEYPELSGSGGETAICAIRQSICI